MIGSTANDLTVSGRFLRMDSNHTLGTVCDMILRRTSFTLALRRVENKLLACNNPLSLARLGRWCEARRKDFHLELTAIAAKLETRKQNLTIALRELDDKLREVNVNCDDIAHGCVSLIPSAKPLDSAVEQRRATIDQHPTESAFNVCKFLDSRFGGILPIGFLPETWVEKYGVKTFVEAYRHPDCRNLVQAIISKRRRRAP